MGPLAIGAIMAGGAALGGIAGGQRQNSTQEYTKVLAPESALEKQMMEAMGGQYTDYSNLIGAGPGIGDVNASNDSARQLAAMLGQYSQGGYLPTASDQAQAQQFTQSMFAPEQMALQQRFGDQQMMANRTAARMGRAQNDPILAAKLAQEQARQQQMLGAQQQQFFAQQAQQMPLQRLGFQQQMAQVQGGLATQALANRQALLSMGNQIKSGEQNFRAGTASGIQSTSSGGGTAGALMGALGGMGAAGSLVGMFNKPSTPGAGGSSPQFGGYAGGNANYPTQY